MGAPGTAFSAGLSDLLPGQLLTQERYLRLSALTSQGQGTADHSRSLCHHGRDPRSLLTVVGQGRGYAYHMALPSLPSPPLIALPEAWLQHLPSAPLYW